MKKLLNLVCLKNLRRLDNKKLLTIYKKMFWLDSASWKLGGHIETFDPCTEALLAELLQKYNAVIPADDLAAPGRPSVYLKEEAELAKETKAVMVKGDQITAKILKRGNKIMEIPISYKGRAFNEGKKISWKDAFAAIWTLIKYRFAD